MGTLTDTGFFAWSGYDAWKFILAYLNRGRIELGLLQSELWGWARSIFRITKPLNLIFDGLCLTLGFLSIIFCSSKWISAG